MLKIVVKDVTVLAIVIITFAMQFGYIETSTLILCIQSASLVFLALSVIHDKSWITYMVCSTTGVIIFSLSVFETSIVGLSLYMKLSLLGGLLLSAAILKVGCSGEKDNNQSVSRRSKSSADDLEAKSLFELLELSRQVNSGCKCSAIDKAGLITMIECAKEHAEPSLSSLKMFTRPEEMKSEEGDLADSSYNVIKVFNESIMSSAK